MSGIPRVGVEDIGTCWTREDGSVWRLIAFAEEPTVIWERLDGDSHERRGGCVGSQITAGFVRLVPENPGSVAKGGTA